MHLSHRARTLHPSPTLAIDAKAKDLARKGVDLVNLGAGEPDFDTPKQVVAAADAAARAGKTKYTATAGIPELREGIVRHLRATLGLDYDPAQVVVTNGAKQALYNALQALVDPGDEVAIFAPYWVSYPDMVALAGGRAVAVASDPQSFLPDLHALERAITPRTRGVIVNSPNNPTGAVYPREFFQRLVAIARDRDLWILSDEIYELLVYDGAKHVSPAQIGREGFDQTLIAGGFSKSYAMTGWRLGYLVAPREVASVAANLQGQMTSNVNTPTQWAGVAALACDPAEIQAMVTEFAARRELLREGLRRVLGSHVAITEPRGAFYLLQDVRPLLERSFRDTEVRTDRDLAEALLHHARVATVPGSAFAAPGHIRLSYATSRANLEKAIERLAAFVRELR